MNKVKVDYTVTHLNGTQESFSTILELPTTSTESVFQALWSNCPTGISEIFVYVNTAGFVVRKITEIDSEFEEVPDSQMRLPHEGEYCITARYVFREQDTERTFNYATRAASGQDAMDKLWREVVTDSGPWCDDAARVKSVTFEVQRRGGEKVIYEAPAAASGLTPKEQTDMAHNGGIFSGKGLINRYRIYQGRKQVYCEDRDCAQYYNVEEFEREHKHRG